MDNLVSHAFSLVPLVVEVGVPDRVGIFCIDLQCLLFSANIHFHLPSVWFSLCFGGHCEAVKNVWSQQSGDKNLSTLEDDAIFHC